MAPCCAWLTTRRVFCSNSSCAHVEFLRGDARVRGRPAGGFARQFQPALCPDAIGAATRSAFGPLVRVHQPPSQSDQDSVLGRQRIMDLRETFGKGSLFLAACRAELRQLARRGIDRAPFGPGSAPQSRLVSALRCAANNFQKSFAAFEHFSAPHISMFKAMNAALALPE